MQNALSAYGGISAQEVPDTSGRARREGRNGRGQHPKYLPNMAQVVPVQQQVIVQQAPRAGCQGLGPGGLPVEPKDASFLCKFCCPTEVVYAHGGCQGENMMPMILATILGGWYAAFCWNPTYPRVRTEANIVCKICCP
jgi:hypothetical protein